jgi:cell division protein FtsQ
VDRPEGFQPNKTVRGKTKLQKSSPANKARLVQKATTKRRQQAERAEYRRFTEETRRRRLVWGVSLGSIGAVALATVLLVLSPALAFRTVQVEGANRVGEEQVVAALQPFYGEPLARVSPERVAAALEPITLIQGFTVRIQPPGTLILSIVEREPLGFVASSGGFDVVDAAGVTLWSSQTAPVGMPLILVSAEPESPSFVAVSRVLLVLPAEIRGEVEGIRATTLDDVRFTIRDRDHEVVWGSSERSTEKARVLGASLLAAGVEEPKEIDLSTPESVVIRERP